MLTLNWEVLKVPITVNIGLAVLVLASTFAGSPFSAALISRQG